MAEEPKTENWDEEIAKIKRLLEQLKRTQKVFSATFMTMRLRDRAIAARHIAADHSVVSNFLIRASRANVNTTAFRFSMENIKVSFQTLKTLWRKTEKLMDEAAGGGGTQTGIRIPKWPQEKQTDQAVNDYAEKLSALGKNVTPEAIQTFRDQLENSYEKAKEKFQGREFSVQVVERDGKIKVRFEPK